MLLLNLVPAASVFALEGQRCRRAGEARATAQGIYGCLKNGKKGLQWRLIQPAITTTSSSSTTTTVYVACALGGPCRVDDVGPGGGTVFYVHPNGGTFVSPGSDCNQNCRYLEAAPSLAGGDSKRSGEAGSDKDLSSNVRVPINGAAGVAVGTGFQNTLEVARRVGNSAANSAAVVAAEFVNGGKSDWHLPSIDELVALHLERLKVGGFNRENYWSSTQSPPIAFYVCGFGGEGCSNRGLAAAKWMVLSVRPVRAF